MAIDVFFPLNLGLKKADRADKKIGEIEKIKILSKSFQSIFRTFPFNFHWAFRKFSFLKKITKYFYRTENYRVSLVLAVH